MISEFTYSGDTSDLRAESCAAGRDGSSAKISKGLKRLFIIAAVIFAAELVWLFGISPFIPFSVIDVHSFASFERNEVLSLAGIDDTSAFFSTNINEVREKISSNILVESAVVTKRFPDKLSIFLTPRQPAAVALTAINSKPALVYVDRQGVFYKAEEKALDEINLPAISGIENPQVSMRMPDALVSLTESLFTIAQSSPELLASVSEVRIERKTWEGFELVIYPVHSSIKVRIENNLTEDALRYMLLILNVFDSASAKPEEIDFRSGMGSYKIKEQSL